MSAEQGKELSSLDFGAMIGGPLTAVVKAQAQAALSTATFIKQVGFEHDPSTHAITKAMNVDFVYDKPLPGGGKQESKLSVPLLTILPIPFIQVDVAEINFNAKLLSVTHNDLMSQDKSDVHFQSKTGGYFNWYASASLKANYSHQSQRTEKSQTKDTYGLTVHVKASQAEIPAGMDKVLNILEALIEETPASATISSATISGTTVTISGYSFGTTAGTVTATGRATVDAQGQSVAAPTDLTLTVASGAWTDTQITATASAGATQGDAFTVTVTPSSGDPVKLDVEAS